MEQFKKFVDVYNRKLAAMKGQGGKEGGVVVEDLEELGDATAKFSPRNV